MSAFVVNERVGEADLLAELSSPDAEGKLFSIASVEALEMVLLLCKKDSSFCLDRVRIVYDGTLDSLGPAQIEALFECGSIKVKDEEGNFVSPYDLIATPEAIAQAVMGGETLLRYSPRHILIGGLRQVAERALSRDALHQYLVLHCSTRTRIEEEWRDYLIEVLTQKWISSEVYIDRRGGPYAWDYAHSYSHIEQVVRALEGGELPNVIPVEIKKPSIPLAGRILELFRQIAAKTEDLCLVDHLSILFEQIHITGVGAREIAQTIRDEQKTDWSVEDLAILEGKTERKNVLKRRLQAIAEGTLTYNPLDIDLVKEDVEIPFSTLDLYQLFEWRGGVFLKTEPYQAASLTECHVTIVGPTAMVSRIYPRKPLMAVTASR